MVARGDFQHQGAPRLTPPDQARAVDPQIDMDTVRAGDAFQIGAVEDITFLALHDVQRCAPPSSGRARRQRPQKGLGGQAFAG
ncbi:hypothetical protein D3C71_1835310 [compost metagenome]